MTRQHRLSRRSLFGAGGALLALPCLEAMGSGAAQAAPSLAPVRLIFVVWPHGVAMAEEGAFQSTGEGTNFELGSDLRELMAPYKSRLLVPTNIARREPKGPGDHPRGYGSLLTARMLDQGSIRNGVS